MLFGSSSKESSMEPYTVRIAVASSDGDLHVLDATGDDCPTLTLTSKVAQAGSMSAPILLGQHCAILGSRKDYLHCLQLC